MFQFYDDVILSVVTDCDTSVVTDCDTSVVTDCVVLKTT